MTFLAPFMLLVGGLAATAAVALHLLTTRRPPTAVLPTARFVPMSEARAVSRSRTPTDLGVLTCRVLAVLLLGAAFAGPVLDAPGPAVRSVVMLDVSASVADLAAAARLAAARVTAGGALVLFDTSARELNADEVAEAVAAARAPSGAGPSVATMHSIAAAPRATRGILSAALVAATRAARRVSRGADSVKLVLVSPLAEQEFDAATDALRAEWPGGIDVMRVPVLSDTALGGPIRLMSPLADDPIMPALARLPSARGAHEVRIVRRPPSATDSAWARDSGHVLVVWPSPAEATPVADGVTAFGLRQSTIVAPLVRMPLDASVMREDNAARRGSLQVGSRVVARVVARWRDGAAAATESALAAGCVRQVAVGIPLSGDLTLRQPFEHFLAAMVEPCGGARGGAVSDSIAERFAGGPQAASASSLAVDANPDPRIAALLLALAVVALGVEWLLRQRRDA